jgi:membrane protease YdiL (CAAX protease family)
MSFLKNRVFVAYAVLYVLSVILLVSTEQFPVGEVLLILGICGVGMTYLSSVLTKRAKPFFLSLHPDGQEILLLLVYVAAMSVFLAFGFGGPGSVLARLFGQSELGQLVTTTVSKLMFFVLAPAIIFGLVFNYSVRDFGVQFERSAWKSHIPVLAGMGIFLVLFQFFLGEDAAPVRQGKFSAVQLLAGMPLVYLWLVVEVGLVEEFFFRSLLQSRLSLFLRSEMSGIVLASLIFGLAHAPGIYLRGAETLTATGGSPSLVGTIGYSVAMLSVTGFFLGLIWARTKNLLLVALIHAAGDLLPNFSEMARIFGL